MRCGVGGGAIEAGGLLVARVSAGGAVVTWLDEMSAAVAIDPADQSLMTVGVARGWSWVEARGLVATLDSATRAGDAVGWCVRKRNIGSALGWVSVRRGHWCARAAVGALAATSLGDTGAAILVDPSEECSTHLREGYGRSWMEACGMVVWLGSATRGDARLMWGQRSGRSRR